MTLTNLAEHMHKEGTRCLSLPSMEEMQMKISWGKLNTSCLIVLSYV